MQCRYMSDNRSVKESIEAYDIYSQHKMKNGDNEGALELLLRAFNLSNNKPLLTFDFLNLTLTSFLY